MVTAPNTRLNNQRREKSLKKGLWYFKNLTREKVYFERNTKKKKGLILNKKGREKSITFVHQLGKSRSLVRKTKRFC